MSQATEANASDGWGESHRANGGFSRQPVRVGGRSTAFAIAVACIFCATALFAAGWVCGPGRAKMRQRVLPGEFESHDALVVAWPKAKTVGPEVQRKMFADIIRAASPSIDIVVLTPDDESEAEIVEYLRQQEIETDQLRYIRAPSALLWVRDYGPLTAKSFGGGIEILDTIYYRGAEHPGQDQVPGAVGAALGLPSVEVPLVMENGNLLSNGAGLCVTTTKLLRVNAERKLSESDVTRILRDQAGAEEVIYLEPLLGEPNEHVDMFMTFTGPDTVVVGQYEPSHDQENAALLDRNAERLSQVKTACGPLRVHRVPMPDRIDGNWYTFTNVVFANGRMLVPSYGRIHATAEKKSIAVYQSLLPTWDIVSVDCSEVIYFNGSLHCATANLMTSDRATKSRQFHATAQ